MKEIAEVNKERHKQTAVNVYSVEQKKINTDITKYHKGWKGRRK